MKRKLKAILLPLLILILAYAIIQALMSLADEAARSDDYFFVRSGYEVSEPVLFESEGK